MILLFLAIFPPLFVIYRIYKIDKYEKEPLLEIIITFFLGCCTVIPVFIFSPIVNNILSIPYSIIEMFGGGLIGRDEVKTFIFAFIGARLRSLVISKNSLNIDLLYDPNYFIFLAVLSMLVLAPIFYRLWKGKLRGS